MQGRKTMAEYSHTEWNAIPFAPGTLQALAFKNGSSSPVAVAWQNTTGVAAQVSSANIVDLDTILRACG